MCNQLLTPVDSFWFGTDSQILADEDRHNALTDKLLALENVSEIEHFEDYKIHTHCNRRQLPEVMKAVYDLLAEFDALTPLGMLKHRFKAKVSLYPGTKVAFLVVFPGVEYDWYEMLEYVQKIDKGYTLGKSTPTHQTFEKYFD